MYREESARIQHRMSSFLYISFIIFGIKGRHDQAFTYVVLPVVCGMKAPLLIVTNHKSGEHIQPTLFKSMGRSTPFNVQFMWRPTCEKSHKFALY